VGGISERGKEIKRRRHRRKKLAVFARKLKNANASERGVITDKLRSLTPGATAIIGNWELNDTKR